MMATSSEVRIDIRLPKFDEVARRALSELPPFIAANMQTQRGQIFNSEGRYNGRPGWAPLRYRVGQILAKRGVLKRSLAPRNSGTRPGKAVGTIARWNGEIVTIGTEIAYARIHNEGGVIVPKNKKVLAFQVEKGGGGKGKKWVFAKKVVIPQRQFNDINQNDAQELKEAITNYLAHLVRQA